MTADSPRPRVIRWSTLAAQPWANGAGRTVSVMQSPPSAPLDEVDWRVSVAEVDGPSSFSDFTGYTRWFASLEPEGVLLVVDARPHRLPQWQPLDFDGSLPAHAEPPRVPARDLNLMVRSAYGDGSIHRHDLDAGERLRLRAPATGWRGLLVLGGEVRIPDAALSALDAVLVPAGAPDIDASAAAGSATVMELRVRPGRR